jgi:uncharacterized protein (TIGR01777 family)
VKVAVTGSSGFIGTALVASLRTDGHEVLRVLRSDPPVGEPAVRWDPARGAIDVGALEGVEAVVHLAGTGIGDKRWTDERKALIKQSRTRGTALLAETLAGLSAKPRVLVSASGVHWYGDRGDEVLTEDSDPGDGFLADVCRQWEAAAGLAALAGIRVVTTRSGLVLSADGGVFPKMMTPARFGLGGRLGSGRQWWSWITLTDEVDAMRFLIDHDNVAGPVNLAAPNPVTNAEFASTLGRVLHRPAFVPVPSFGPKLVLGSEMAGELLFGSVRAQPAALQRAGFRFSHPELEGALRAVLDRPAT